MQSYMLSVDTKKTAQLLMEKALRKYVEQQGLAESMDTYEKALAELHNLRESIRNAHEKSEAILATYYRYYGMIASLDKRVPITEQEVRLQFCWYDIFKQKKSTQYSAAFERVNLLFNMGAILSYLGTSESRATDDGVKNAYKYFQMAAGFFTKVKDELEKNPTSAEGNDLSGDAVTLLVNLMLAQAQESFYERASRTMKPITVAKLSYQVTVYFDMCVKAISAAPLKSVVPSKWLAYAETKSHVYKAITYYQLGLDRGQAEAYGEQCSRLGSAYRLLDEEKKKKLPSELQDWVNQLHALVGRTFASAQKDNNTVYHEVVPSESKLSPLEGKSMAAATAVDDSKLALLPGSDPFQELVPFSVRKADSIYSERKAELLRETGKNLEEQDQIAKASLNALGLPGAIEAFESPTGIPAPLLQKLNTVRAENGVRMLTEQVELVDKVASQDEVILKESLSILDAEEKEDSDMRGQYHDRWNRTPSHTLTAHLRQEAAKHAGNLEHARKSDEFVKQKLKASADAINKLTWPTEKVVAELPSDESMGGQAQSATAIVAKLKQSIAQLTTIIQTRDGLMRQLRELAAKDDITPKMLQVKETEFESLFAQELFKYNDLSGTIKSTFTDQATLLTQIQAENDSFLKQRSSNAQLESRQKVLQQYENAYKTFVELKGHLKDGINFYTKFQEHLTKFKIKCSDFAFARKTEKSDLLADLQAQAAGLATAQAHSSPSQLSQSHTHSMSPLAGSAFASPLAAPNLYTQAHPVYQQQQQGPPPYVAAPAQNLAGTFVMQGQQYTHQPQQYNQQSFYAASPQPGMVPGPYMQHPQQQLQQQPPPGYHVVYPGNQPAPGY